MPTSPNHKKQGKRNHILYPKKNGSIFEQIGITIKQGCLFALKQIGLAIIQCGYVIGQFFVRLVKRIASARIPKGLLARITKAFFPVLLGGVFMYAVLGFSGIGGYIVQSITPIFAETAFAAAISISAIILVALISFIPVISPLLGPGMVITVIAAIASGLLLASGHISPFIALPALFAIDVQLGNMFPASYAVAETEPETLAAGVPEIYFTRLITLPAAVAAAYFFSFIVFK
jgi:sorbitol-specific phosphotransferase system component IIBC